MGSGVRKDNPPADNNNLIFDGLLSGELFFHDTENYSFFFYRDGKKAVEAMEPFVVGWGRGSSVWPNLVVLFRCTWVYCCA